MTHHADRQNSRPGARVNDCEASARVAPAWDLDARVRVWVIGHAVELKRRIEARVGAARRPPSGPIDVAILAPTAIDECVYFARKALRRLTERGTVRVVFAGTGPDLPPSDGVEPAPDDRAGAAVEGLSIREAARVVDAMERCVDLVSEGWMPSADPPCLVFRRGA